MITGGHVLIYTDNADQYRAFFRDVLELSAVEAGDGWPLFALPPAEIGVHPSEQPTRHELWLMCDDIAATVRELQEKGVELAEDVSDEGYGLVARVAIPGGGDLAIYQPRHRTAVTG